MATVKILGDPPLARGKDGALRNTIGTAFPDDGVVISGRGIHAMLKLEYIDSVNKERVEKGLPKLTPAEERTRLERAVDLVMREDSVFIRPEPERMDLAFAADELLQCLSVPKTRIRFLGVMEQAVREAIKRRGELWRIHPLPRTAADMCRMIENAKCTLDSGTQFYYSMETGTRLLTWQEFERIGELPPLNLALALREIRFHYNRHNKMDHPEISFFKHDASFSSETLKDLALEGIEQEPERLRAVYEGLKARYREAVAPEFQIDDPQDHQWRIAMVQELLGYGQERVSEEILMGLGSEFHLRVQWLPGARLEQGELIYDSIFEEAASDPRADALCDERVRSIIFNLLRQHEDQLDYLNIARVPESLSKRASSEGRREVYLAELKQAQAERENVCMLRMQKWDVREHLLEDERRDLLRAMLMSQEYTEYCLDRHLGCRQLGMNLLPIKTGTVTEHWEGRILRSTYFQREYAYGVATDKLPPSRYADADFAPKLACLLGEAAAPNIVVGRCDAEGKVLFDDGDEVLLGKPNGIPERLIVTDSSGSFADYRRDLDVVIPDYGEVVLRRRGLAPSLSIFAELYVHHFEARLTWLKEQYGQYQRAFRSLFRHRKYDEEGCFAYRWEQVMDRLGKLEPQRLGEQLRNWLRDRL